MGKELTKGITAKEKALKAYDDALPDLISSNILLQKKALNVIEEKIDACSAAQAATIYGILHDKCTQLVGARNEQNNQFNVYIGDGGLDLGENQDYADMMQRVINRMHSHDAEDDSEMEVVDNLADDSDVNADFNDDETDIYGD